jgi:hypothetical protein
MGELHHITRDKPRTLGEVVWTEEGLTPLSGTSDRA